MTDPFSALDGTWPAAAVHRAGPWLVREGRGGGSRVSAATAAAAWEDGDIELAEKTQARLGQDSLFMIRQGDERLDRALEARDYAIADPVSIWSAPAAAIAAEPSALSAFAIWPPLAIMCDIWAEGGTGGARLAVMERVRTAKIAILGRAGDRAAGTAFIAVSGGRAMLHALHVRHDCRRRGSAGNMMRLAAKWAQDHGAAHLSLAVTVANAPANALYASLGMAIVGNYHYRIKLARERQ